MTFFGRERVRDRDRFPVGTAKPLARVRACANEPTFAPPPCTPRAPTAAMSDASDALRDALRAFCECCDDVQEGLNRDHIARNPVLWPHLCRRAGRAIDGMEAALRAGADPAALAHGTTPRIDVEMYWGREIRTPTPYSNPAARWLAAADGAPTPLPAAVP